jgi:hypothetical protein
LIAEARSATRRAASESSHAPRRRSELRIAALFLFRIFSALPASPTATMFRDADRRIWHDIRRSRLQHWAMTGPSGNSRSAGTPARS